MIAWHRGNDGRCLAKRCLECVAGPVSHIQNVNLTNHMWGFLRAAFSLIGVSPCEVIRRGSVPQTGWQRGDDISRAAGREAVRRVSNRVAGSESCELGVVYPVVQSFRSRGGEGELKGEGRTWWNPVTTCASEWRPQGAAICNRRPKIGARSASFPGAPRSGAGRLQIAPPWGRLPRHSFCDVCGTWDRKGRGDAKYRVREWREWREWLLERAGG